MVNILTKTGNPSYISLFMQCLRKPLVLFMDTSLRHRTTRMTFYAYIEHLISDREVQVRTNEICLFVMREYIKTIPKYTKITIHSVRFSYRINNQSKFIEHG